MATTKRARTNSVAGQVALAQHIAAEPPSPTEDLDDDEMKAFRRILRSRETASWSEHDIALATHCAQQMVLAFEYTKLLKEQGPVIFWTTPSGNTKPAANPMLQARTNAYATVASLNKQLGLSASQKGLSGANQTKRNAAERTARDAIEKASDESLI